MSTFDVVVVGAGCAGLSAAALLAQEGARVLVVEARPVLGGRTFATHDHASGDWVDNGQHALLGCYHDTLAFVRRVGAARRLLFQGALAVPMVDREGRASELRCPGLPAPLHLVAGVGAWSALSWKDRLSVLHMSRALSGGVAGPGASETVRDWLRRSGQTDRLCEFLWEPLAVAALNQPTDRATAATFAEVLRRMLGPGADDAAIVLPTGSLSETFVDPAVAFIGQRGGEVRAGAAARVVIGAGRVAGVRIRHELVAASVVISAVPWHAFGGLFDRMPAKLEELAVTAAAMRSAPIATVNLWFDRPALEVPFVGLPGRVFQWAFDKRTISNGRATHVSLVCSSAGDVVALSNEALVEIAHRELSTALPEVRRARLLRGTAVRERRATFSLEAGEPARPGTATPLNGFLLAGDWVDTGLPATIESAVISGHRAARAALASRT